jgi:hypothetical protein
LFITKHLNFSEVSSSESPDVDVDGKVTALQGMNTLKKLLFQIDQEEQRLKSPSGSSSSCQESLLCVTLKISRDER